jgi:hypothetical protein
MYCTKASHRRTIKREICSIVSAEESCVEHTLVLRFLQSSHATGTTCTRWGMVEMIVHLERLSVKKASGVAASR